MAAVTLRRATPDDIGFIMRTERLPGYDSFIGKFDENEHQRQLNDPAFLYFIGEHGTDLPVGFAILSGLDNRDGNVCLKRLAVATPDKGYGSHLLLAIIEHTFENTPVHRLWLDVVKENTRASSVYRKAGFKQEGTLRESAVMPDGRRTDLVMMSILRPEWTSHI
ncbi:MULTISPECIES: GNAT family N-acetyltransferase [Alphaproteobacteria]|uniref:GNAT family N-acetyltransferase n=2 Tax=Alphaproteobacteria TaxID=28211 RepID=A0A512HGN2_9HYPH|nr:MULTISPECIES: GNAT family protein [Alphaproteobacteria]GEO84591.1 GNAT family N-acetyltransferase [Ciceribacter naphthalenivorans]GLR22554.1 GNAT family N-acetyltransferase [Ciceribacter naphthalenivorans]GLT05410.1 GNAT family N-acetyltransferase [Sphingomonas psychrolutea]